MSALRFLFAPLFCLLFAPVALTAQKTIHVPGDAPTIQAGINLASSGDTVLVAPGTYLENLRFPSRSITVTSSDGPAKTTIDANNLNPAADFGAGATRATVLNGFTLLHGGQTGTNIFYGAAGSIVLGSNSFQGSPTISNNILVQSNCTAILLLAGSPRIVDNTIRQTNAPGNCSAGWGSPIFLDGYPALDGVPVTEISGNLIESNVSASVSGIINNVSGGITLQQGSAVIHHNIIRNNRTTGAGGAISLGYYLLSQVYGNLIYGNYAERGGGGIYLQKVAGRQLGQTIVSNTIVDNQIGSTRDPNFGITGSQIGLVSGPADTTLLFENNVIAGTSSDPLIDCSSTTLVFSPNLDHHELSFDHTLFWNSGTGGVFGSSCTDRSTVNMNLVADPLFVDRTLGNYRLQAGSPGVDSGTNAEAVLPPVFVEVTVPPLRPIPIDQDLDGSPRVQDATGLGYGLIDRGAYERSGASSPVGTLVSIAVAEPLLVCKPTTVTSVLTSTLGTPAGNVTFFDNDLLLGSAQIDATGRAVLTTLPVNTGFHEYRAVYAGDGIRSPGTSTVYAPDLFSFTTCGPTAAIQLTSSSNPAQIVTPVTFTASVTGTGGTPTGSITFADGGTTLASVPLKNGAATFTTATLARGTHSIVATYSGASPYPSTSTSLAQRVIGYPSTTTVTASATNVGANVPVMLTSSVSVQGGGTADLSKLQIVDGSTPLLPLTITSATSATITVTLTPGTHTLTAAFGGDTSVEPSSSAPLIVTVSGATTSVQLGFNPTQGAAFQTFSALATVQSATPGIAPSGSVTFAGLGAPAQTVALSAAGAAPLAINAGAGTYTVTASYTPSNGNTLASSVTAHLVINRAPVSLALVTPFPAPIPQSQSATFAVQFDDGTGRNLASGAVVPAVDGVALPPVPLTANGKLSFTLSGLLPGAHHVTVTYPGDTNFLPATSTAVDLVVLERDFKLSADPGITLRAGTYRSVSLALTSIGDFVGDVDLHCENLPARASCRFSKAPLHVNAGGNSTELVTIETSALPGYRSDSATNDLTKSRIVTATVAPLAMFALLGLRRRRTGLHLLVLCLVTFGVLVTLTGCTGQLPASTPAGTYTVQIVGAANGIQHAQAITVTVTAEDGR